VANMWAGGSGHSAARRGAAHVASLLERGQLRRVHVQGRGVVPRLCVAMRCHVLRSWLMAGQPPCAIPIAKCKLENVWSYIYQITRSLGRENYWGGNTLLISSREWRVGVKKAMTIVPCPFQSSFPLRPRLFFLPPCDRGTNLQSVVLGEVPAPWRLWCRRCGC
jgi:hypothetical protein